MFEWSYGGVDFNLPGNGGRECAEFLPMWQRVLESGLACLFAASCIAFAYSRVRLPERIPKLGKSERCGKRILLVAMCLTFGMELGYKFATRQVIYLLNPCHLTTMIQIYILAAPPSRVVTAMFRIHLYMMSGAPIAIIFPVINTLMLPFETEVYFIQHILMMIIPYYLIRIGGVYTPEKLSEKSWAILSVGFLYFLYFVPLNYLAVGSHVNINNMLCPAISDPFYGRLYRICAMLHQLILLPAVGKLIPVSAKYLKITPDEDIRETLVFIKETKTEDSTNSESEKVTSSINSYSDSEISQTITDRNSTENGFKTKFGDKNGVVHNEGHCGDSVKQRLIGNGHLKEAKIAG